MLYLTAKDFAKGVFRDFKGLLGLRRFTSLNGFLCWNWLLRRLVTRNDLGEYPLE